MLIYCICTQYFNYCLNSAWHGGDQFVALLRWCEAQISLTVAFSSSAFFGLLFLIFLLTIPHRFSMFRSGEFAGQSRTPTPWSFNQRLVLLAVWAGAESCWKMKSASLKSCSAEGSMKCSLVNQTETILKTQETFAGVLSWLACHHIIICWEWIGGFLLNVSQIITIKRTKDLNYFSLCALNLFNTRVSQFELNYWNKWTFPQHSNLLRCTCRLKRN